MRPKRYCNFFFVVVIISLISRVVEAESIIPFLSDEIHLGVSSCTSSTCHGSIQPWSDSNVLQNEYITWEDQDPHSQAYKILLTDESQRIARNLGLGSAEKEEVCLNCHADNVPEEIRAKTFQISDGVGCEACHGGANNWMSVHVSGSSDHKKNIAAGMYPTDQPLARAKLCLSCHFGTEDRFVTHKIMGAGHPRMSFELDTYTWTQPAHYKVDDDYVSRKGKILSVKVWAVGQAFAINTLLDAMTDPSRNKDGIFPELVFYDCHSCHHPMSDIKWVPRDSHGTGPGIPRIFDANMIMMKEILNRIDNDISEEFSIKVRKLHQSSIEGFGSMTESANRLKTLMENILELITNHSFTKNDMLSIISSLIDKGLSGEYLDYSGAEQAVMAVSAILQTLLDNNSISESDYFRFNSILDGAFEAIEDDESYKMRKFILSFKNLKSALKPLNS